MIEDSCPSLENWGVRQSCKILILKILQADRVEIEVESCFHFSSEGGGQKDEAERMRKDHQREEMKKR